MRAFLLGAFIILCAVAAFAASQKKQQKKPPDVTVLESTVRRETDRLALDGRVRITGEKPLRGLVMVFDFFSVEGDPVSSARAEVTEDELAPGGEATFHGAAGDPVRAVRYKLRAFDAFEKELRIENAGPFTVE
jgi:hypothetical protein